MNDNGKYEWIGLLAVIFIVVMLGIFVFGPAKNKCERAGGVYLTNEYKCVTGIRELRP